MECVVHCVRGPVNSTHGPHKPAHSQRAGLNTTAVVSLIPSLYKAALQHAVQHALLNSSALLAKIALQHSPQSNAQFFTSQLVPERHSCCHSSVQEIHVMHIRPCHVPHERLSMRKPKCGSGHALNHSQQHPVAATKVPQQYIAATRDTATHYTNTTDSTAVMHTTSDNLHNLQQKKHRLASAVTVLLYGCHGTTMCNTCTPAWHLEPLELPDWCSLTLLTAIQAMHWQCEKAASKPLPTHFQSYHYLVVRYITAPDYPPDTTQPLPLSGWDSTLPGDTPSASDRSAAIQQLQERSVCTPDQHYNNPTCKESNNNSDTPP